MGIPQKLSSTRSSLEPADVTQQNVSVVGTNASAVEEQHHIDLSNNDVLVKPTLSNYTSVNPWFSLTEYLSQDIDSRLSDDQDDANDINDYSDKSNCSNEIYGLHRPPIPIINVCTGCSGVRDAELNGNEADDNDHPVLLCDGVQCGREYHMACCIPPLVSVPDGDDNDDEPWYCYDCSKDGTTLLLQQYLNNNDKEMVDYYSSNLHGQSNMTFVDYRIQQELNIKTSTHGKHKMIYPVPESELVIGAMIHSLALCDVNKLARTRGGNERRESLAPNEYVGKPIRLHDRTHDLYHTGRIVAYRNFVPASSLENCKPLPTFSSKDNTVLADSVPTCPHIECLVRFPAGKDYRKSTYHHWIRLEEHSLSIGSTLVWARITASQWKPSILWLRTPLALITTLNAIDRPVIDSNIDISKTKHKVCALVRTFGEEIYSMINIRDQCVDLSDTDATELHIYSHPDNVLLYSIARTEFAEQLRVQNWFQLKQVNPMDPAILSSRDYWTLRDLYPTTQVDDTKTADKGLLLPNVRRSLDRSKLVRMLYQRGHRLSKDSAASISCVNVAFNNQTILDISLNTDPTTIITVNE